MPTITAEDDDPDSDVVIDNGSDDEPKPDPFGGKSFTELLQEAAKIKGSQMEKKRRVFEKRPEFLKRTLTHHPPKEFDPIREMKGDERLATVEEWKKEGNEIYAKGRYEAARLKYERALSTFYYVRNTNPGWKKKGLYDEDLVVVEFKGETDEHAKKFYALKITLMLNLALALLKAKSWKLCLEPLNEVLKLEPKNVKALYFRARALSLPPSSGATEYEMAIEDLKKARKAAPEHEPVKKLLDKMLRTKRKQRAVDKKTFAGLFNRGEVVEEVSPEEKERLKTERNAKTRREFEQQMADVEKLANTFEKQGKKKEAKRMKAHLDNTKKKLRQAKNPQLDFSNPSDKMIEDAKKMKLDLTDPQVLAALQDLQRRHAAGEDITDDDDTKPDRAATASITQRKTPQSYYHIIVPVMVSFLLWRLYSLGLLQWLLQYGSRQLESLLMGEHGDRQVKAEVQEDFEW